MARGTAKRQAFTLIELLVVVAILALLAAIAIPAFTGYRKRANTSEAPMQLALLFKSAAALYVNEQSNRGVAVSDVRSCVAEPTALMPTPHGYRQKFTSLQGFQQLNFDIGDLVYFGYGISSIGTPGTLTCLGHSVPTSAVYTFYAQGNLDDDTDLSLFELVVAADNNNQLYRGSGFYIANEIE